MKRKKLIRLSVGLAFSVFLINACEQNNAVTETVPLDQPALIASERYGEQMELESQRNALYRFVTEELSDGSGIYTNYKDTDQSAEVATGHELLSESSGLMMRYYALIGDQEAFAYEWEQAKQTFDLASGFSYRYSPLLNKKYSLNAAVDDLRIIRALYEGAEVFANAAYKDEAVQYGSRFLTHNVKEGKLYDFYDETYEQTNTFITLCYIDLKTLGLLGETNASLHELNEKLLSVIEGGFLSKDFPFYETRYSYDKENYSSESIRTVESLLTILALAEMGQQREESISFIKKQVEAGTLYGSYTSAGVRDSDIQSTAIYAITAMIGSELGDRSLYEASINRMNDLQVWSEGSPFHGGFADPPSGQAFSFDNLMALLAYAY